MNAVANYPDKQVKDFSNLYFAGREVSASERLLAIVGSRSACETSIAATESFAGVCSSHGYGVVSGLARGCDAAAHLGSIDSGGYTVAVLPAALDCIAPVSHRPLASRILETGGCLVSEYPPGTPPRSFRFVERNRVIASLSRAVLIMEAEAASGTMHTARFALEQGKPLACYVPESGRVSSGCRLLVENHGALSLRNAADLASFLETLSNTTGPNPFSWQGRGEGGWRV